MSSHPFSVNYVFMSDIKQISSTGNCLPVSYGDILVLNERELMEKNAFIFLIQAPAFIFVDEIDAIAGRHARRDRRRRFTFEALIDQLDGESVSCFIP